MWRQRGYLCPYFCNRLHNPVEVPYPVSPDGKLVASGGRLGTGLWDVETDAHKSHLETQESVTRETDLYEPIKRFLEQQGYEVKAEIGAADVVAVRGDEPPLIVETKTGFSLSLFHQGIERQSITDLVYVAVPAGRGLAFRRALHRNLKLCRRLGLGLITVGPREPRLLVHADPAAYRPRQSKGKKARLLGEFLRRVGDPNVGGSTRQGLVTAYRQEAMRCARFLSEHGATKAAHVAKGSGVPHARRIMADNHYGWFQRVGAGIYDLTPEYNLRLHDRAGNCPSG